MNGIGELIEQMKNIAKRILEADRPAEVVYGTMAGPGRVRISQQVTLTGDQILFPQPFAFYAPPTPSPGEDPPPAAEWYQVEEGDAVLLLKNRHGQSYVLLGKK